ncbi:MAG: hypothetical protein L6R40_007862 [Gallowayella cf. fulva]|nr:MAG: hypothetical protein L6R40_007862 [Xanthomendoza cf. fulva]
MDTMLVSDETSPPEQRLLEACENGHYATVVRLLSSRDDVPVGCKALLGAAAAKGHPDIVRFFLTKYDQEQLHVNGYHALMGTFGGLDCYRLICDRDPSLLHQDFPYNGSALQ